MNSAGRADAGGHFVKHHSKRVQVCPMIERLILNLLCDMYS